MPLGTSIPTQTTDIKAKVIHRFVAHPPKTQKQEQSQAMNQFRRIRLFSAFALALAMAFSWQQASGAKASAPEPWTPVLDAPIHLIGPFRQPNSDYSAGHRGVDFKVKLGQSVYSPVTAQVHFNRMIVNRPVLSLATSSGDLIEFEPACSSLPVGTVVSAGQVIANVCSSLNSYVEHCPETNCLHFSLRTKNGYLSPMVRYGALAPSVLLPYF